MSQRFDWDELRRDLGDVQRAFSDDSEMQRKARARFLLAASAVKRPPRLRFAPGVCAALATAALVLISVTRFWDRDEVALSFRAGNGASPAPLGAWLSPSGAQALPLQFSDGTVVSLAAASRARVVRTTPHGADIVLEQGSLRCSVVHHDGGRWHVGAGPFRVLVTGTTFDVSWNAADATFSLALRDGRVKVDGPTLGSDGYWVKPGEQLRVALNEGSPSSAFAPSPSAAPQPASPAGPAPSAAKKAEQVSASTEWKELARRQRYAEALHVAEAAGFEATCRSASASDLVLLGNTARFAGAAGRAEQAFRLVRSRFIGSPEASTAAFFLGRIAYDHRGDRRDAANWFQVYVREAPNGALAREAGGRLLEAERALGDRSAGRAAARAYLDKYPSGPHAGLAREMLEP